MTLKTLLRNSLRALGYDIIRYKSVGAHNGVQPVEPAWTNLARLLNQHNIDLVFDVGANTGVYADSLFNHGFKGRIVSFEPLTQAYDQLLAKAEKNELWQVAERCALGDIEGEIEMNISANLESSSILPMLSACEQAAPDARYHGKETVLVKKLDSVSEIYLKGANSPFLKLDVQGFEDRVLAGAKETLPKIKGIQIELSLVPLYDKQKLWRELIDEITVRGFELHGLLPGFSDPKTEQILQMDGVFFRSLAAQEDLP